MLTGKAKSDFEKWYWNDWLTGSDRDYHEKDEVIENSWKAEKLFLFPLIIEWLDSVGIYVETGVYPCQEDVNIYFCGSFFGKLGGWDDDEYYKDRQQATEQAIIKANEIYNSQ